MGLLYSFLLHAAIYTYDRADLDFVDELLPVSDDVGGRLDGVVAERHGDSVDHLGGHIDHLGGGVDHADAGHAELQPVVAGRLDLGVGQHRQQDVVDAIDLIVNQIDEKRSTDETRVQTHLQSTTQLWKREGLAMASIARDVVEMTLPATTMRGKVRSEFET